MQTFVIAALLVALLCAGRQNSFTCSASIGVNYGQLGNNLLPPQQVVQLLQSTQIAKVKIYDSNPAILKAFANTGYQIVMGLGNEQIESMAADANAAQTWVSQNVATFLPATRISFISVGNEVLTLNNMQLISNLLPAMENIHAALVALNLDGEVKVSTPHSYAALNLSFPPSAGSFRPDLAQTFMEPILDFLTHTNSVFMANVYPFFSYSNNPRDISLSYALCAQTDQEVTDPNTGLSYRNLLSAQVDAVYSAIDKLGYHDLTVVVSETGWPSKGDANEEGAGIQNAMNYNKNLISYITTTSGTPLRPQQAIDVYIFALFNENEKPGPTSERNFGLFNPDGSAVYDCGLMKDQVDPTLPIPVSSQTPSPVSSVNLTIQNPPAQQSPGSFSGSGGNKEWCVAKQGITDIALAAAINYACGEGGADCAAIQPDGACYNPNTYTSHASYAFNNYYQKSGRNSWNCDFRNSATTTTSDPTYGGCIYPSA
ncbi:hypothetical protein O6H91_04G091700 [Diphasiastrum complanatum]|uniref:Uncharacterized protein n=2 Tax=Diphasiastrum complanatum TaxID=34168 RepID=A0ACC2DZ00_DIPCM|nr:hypothetical protein O6H91_04G091700 [Diphasiastrum complanatum]